MRQAIHIFRKDTRALRYPILMSLVWTAVFAFAGSRTRLEFAGQLGVFNDVGGPSYSVLFENVAIVCAYVLPLIWAYLIARVIHAEALSGDRQFWLTRPYSRASLFAAKALFALCYILLPTALAQGAIASAQGLPIGVYLPGLLWEQVLIALALLVPIAALAALTSSLVQFVVAALAVPLLYMASRGLRPWASFEWIRTSAGLTLIALAAAGVLLVQYRWRRTSSARLVALTGVLVVVATLPLFSWEAVFAIQRRVAWPNDVVLTAELVARPRPSIKPQTATREPVGQLIYRFAGPAAGTRIICEAYAFTFEGPEGQIWRSGPSVRSQFYGFSDVSEGCRTTVRLPRAFRESVAGRRVNIHAVIYVSVFGRPESSVVTVGQPATPVRDSGVCQATTYKLLLDGGKSRDMAMLVCRTAFRESPLALVSVNRDTGGSNRLFGGRDYSHSPFPADLRLLPMEYGVLNIPAADTITLTTVEPVAHIRTTVDTMGVLLEDFEIGSWYLDELALAERVRSIVRQP